MNVDHLAAEVVGRGRSDLFASDLEACGGQLRERLGGARVLVVGAAGSIGSATVGAILPYHPAVLHLVDISESNLAELVRDLLSGALPLADTQMRALPLDYGSPMMERFLLQQEPYDFVLNFAALKHVRSEKDVFSLLQMLDTNLVKAERFLGWLSARHAGASVFFVSTDKAANPVSLMGASKRVLEHMLFSNELELDLISSSTRFANVAFSDGSLLASFLHRLDRRQPLAAPRQTRRFFVTPTEAARICLVAAVCLPERRILVPRTACIQEIELAAVARTVLRHAGFEARDYDDPTAAKAGMAGDLERGLYPLLLTARDTSGEKASEQFVGSLEKVEDLGFEQLETVVYGPHPPGALKRFLAWLTVRTETASVPVTKLEIVQAMAEVVGELHHVETGKSLDERM